MGDMKKRRESLNILGPFQIFLPSGERDPETNELVMEETEYEDSEKLGHARLVPKRETIPFLEKVMFKQGRLTGKVEKELQRIREKSESEGLTFHSSIESMLRVLHSWDLTDGGKPVKLTLDAIVEAEVDSDIVYAILGKYNEVVNPPKRLSAK